MCLVLFFCPEDITHHVHMCLYTIPEDIYRLLKDEGVDLIIFEPYYQFIKKTYQFKLSLETFSK